MGPSPKMRLVSPELNPGSSTKRRLSPACNADACSLLWKDDSQICTPEPQIPLKHQKPDFVHNPEKWVRNLQRGMVCIGHLGLPQVPVSLFQLSNPVSILYLCCNKLDQLPSNFFDDLPALAWLDLRFNRLEALPELSKPHLHLRNLIVDGNKLRSLPCSLVLAESLKCISLRGNPLIDPPPAIIRGSTRAILNYLASKDRFPEPEEVPEARPFGIKGPVPQLLPGILKHVCNKKAKGDEIEIVTRFDRAMMTKEAVNTASEPQSCADSKNKNLKYVRKKYSWELWRDVPYDGIDSQRLMQLSIDALKKDALTKLNNNTESILQKTRNKEALQKWRTNSRMKIRNSNFEGLNPPFAVDETRAHEKITPEKFTEEMHALIAKLQELQSSSSVMTLAGALHQVKEAEAIQRKLKQLKASRPSPFPA